MKQLANVKDVVDGKVTPALTDIAIADTCRAHYALANCQDRAIYITGGFCGGATASVLKLDLDTH